MIDLRKEPPNVVTVDGLKELLEQGWLLCIYCHEEPELRSPHYHGVWYVLAIEPKERKRWAALITQRTRRARQPGATSAASKTDLAFREIRTLSTVFTMCKELGYTIPAAPMVPGQSVIIDSKAE
ncbi:hypothetical protein [Paracoccus aestuariivivens]|uniref:Uncharacterized protein n=1 Tax=Paracoccus aestuariivivens TaxID=1820333 RepID=A0A6L6JH31_9RHOB|nr:hypothetical protein [Paracoccus aestuariivivens]MTH79444.1 hypothetical protein [Paracoccus aestuariivivens]